MVDASPLQKKEPSRKETYFAKNLEFFACQKTIPDMEVVLEDLMMTAVKCNDEKNFNKIHYYVVA